MKASYKAFKHPVTGDIWLIDQTTGRTAKIVEGTAMAQNVFEGAPDGRQSEDPGLQVSRFRPRYRALSDDEKLTHDELKDAYVVVERMINNLPPGRYRALAMTALEESCMWSIKQLTDNPT